MNKTESDREPAIRALSATALAIITISTIAALLVGIKYLGADRSCTSEIKIITERK